MGQLGFFDLNRSRNQLWPGGFERNHRRDRHKRIALFIETFVASVQIEETKLSHAKLLRSEHENLEPDLRGGGKRLFFEVPRRQSVGKLLGYSPLSVPFLPSD